MIKNQKTVQINPVEPKSEKQLLSEIKSLNFSTLTKLQKKEIEVLEKKKINLSTDIISLELKIEKERIKENEKEILPLDITQKSLTKQQEKSESLLQKLENLEVQRSTTVSELEDLEYVSNSLQNELQSLKCTLKEDGVTLKILNMKLNTQHKPLSTIKRDFQLQLQRNDDLEEKLETLKKELKILENPELKRFSHYL